MKEQGSYLSEEERERRRVALEQALNDSGCSAAIVVGSPQIGAKRYFRYFTDWNIQSIGGYLLVRPDGSHQAVFRASSQAFWAHVVDWVQDIISHPDPGRYVLEQLHAMRTERVGVVGREFFPVSDYLALDASIPELVDLTPDVDRVMAIKSKEEQQLLRDTAAVFDRAWARVVNEAAPGLTEWDLASLAASELVRGGVSHHVILIGASGSSFAARSAGWPRNRTIGKDEIIQMSLEGPGPSGYSVEIGGTISFQALDEEMERQLAARADGVRAGAEQLRAGGRAEGVATAVAEAFRRGGVQPGYWAGHGIGLGIPESPIIEVGRSDELIEGMAVALHPNAVGTDGRGSLLSRTYLVRPGGGESLSAFSLGWDRVRGG